MSATGGRSDLRPAAVLPSFRLVLIVGCAIASLRLVPSAACAVPSPPDENRDTPDRAYRRLFIAPRAYPDSILDPAARDSALSQLIHLPSTHLTSIRGSTTRWRSIGPTNVGGRVTDLAIDPTNGARWFAATVGGVWRTTDSGHRWVRVSDRDASSIGMLPGVFGAVVVVPGTGEVIVGGGDPSYFDPARSGGKGLWHSTSSGDAGTWTPENASALESAVIFRLRVGPNQDIYAATSAGLYWRHLVNGAPVWEVCRNMTTPCCDVLIDGRTTPPTIDVATYTGAGIQRDSGTGWSALSLPFGALTPGAIALARAPSKPDVLYARVSRLDPPKEIWKTQMLGIYRSDDNGQHWTTVTPKSPSSSCSVPDNEVTWDENHDDVAYAGYNSTIAVDPSDEKKVYCGERRLLHSSDSGAHWCALWQSANANYREDNAPNPWFDMRNSRAHDDIHAITFDPSLGRQRVIVGDDGGVQGLEPDLPSQPFFWTDLNHGLNVTEFYRLTTQQAQQSITAGGTQDNGSLVTYGNRTWFRDYQCDTQEIGVDAAYGCTVYGHCNRDDYGRPYPLEGIPSMIPGSELRWQSILPTSPVYPPVAASVTVPRHVLACARGDLPTLVQSANGQSFSPVANGNLEHGAEVTALARVESANGLGWYDGFADDPGVLGTIDPGVLAYPDPSPGKTPKSKDLPHRPNAVAVDPTQPLLRAVIASNGDNQSGNLFLTIDGGANWTTTPIGSPATGVAWDPIDPNQIWIATDVGVLRGPVSGSSIGPLATCVDGLPGPISVNDIQASKAGTITIGTMGYGAYQIDLAPDAVTANVALCVRDDVFDHGKPFTPGAPDPEHPVTDLSYPNYQAAASGSSGLQFYNSTDIRVDVPSRSKPKNQVDSVDHVSFESTPIDVPDGFPGTIVDRTPHSGDQARVYVQVTNFGTQPAHDVRVYAMWCDPSVGPLTLPADFWATTIPDPGSSFGPLNSSDWHALSGVGGSTGVVLPLIRPEMPEVARFDWSVPSNVPPHVCLVAFVESVEDPLPAPSRGVLDLATLVPQSRHFAQRNLYPVDGMTTINTDLVDLMDKRGSTFRLRFDRPWLDRATRLAVFLPPNTHGPIRGMKTESPPDPALTSGLRASGLDLRTLFVTDSDSSTIEDLRIDRDAPHSMLVVYGSGTKQDAQRGQRFMIRTEQDSTVLGGATWILRPTISGSRDRKEPKPSRPSK